MKIRNSFEIHKSLMKGSEHFAIWMTDRIGTIGFFFLIFLWTVCCLGWNMIAPKADRFDPFPGFVLWLFISIMIQIFLMPLIMVGQNLQGKHAAIVSENDYLINVKSEAEILELKNEIKEIKELLQNHFAKEVYK